MKRTFLISALLAVTSGCFAQSVCSNKYPIFKTDNRVPAKEVYSLGSNPEFSFLSNLPNALHVVSAMKKSTDKRGVAELNRILKEIGFANGIKDVMASSVSEAEIAPGTTGNMGDGKFNSAYIKLSVGGQPVKAWKITSPTGCYVYILAKCGNAFYPIEQAVKTAAIEYPVILPDSIKEVTFQGAGAEEPNKECNCCRPKRRYHHHNDCGERRRYRCR